MADENVVEENTTSQVKIDPVILTPEVVDNFRLNYEDPSEALARDLVSTMQMDYADQMAQDPNFLTYEGLIGGTAPFLDFLPSTKDKTPTERAFTADQAVVLFSNAQPASFSRPFLSEFFKSVPATEAMAATARLTGPRIIPATTAAGASIAGPPGAVVGFGVGTVGTGALSLLSGGATYLFGDYLEEQVMGPDAVITPGQRAEYEAYRTLGGGVGAIRFPWLMSPTSNIAGNAMLSNIANDAGRAQSLKLVSGLDNIISSTGQAARRNVKMTATGELAASAGAAAGAYQAESMDPGATGTRLAAELIGGNLLYATLAKTLPRVLGSETADEVGGMAVTGQQKKLFENINRLYADYGTPEQYDDLVKNLTDPEMTQMLQEAFPGVDFTAAQRGGDLLLMGIEAVKAGGEPGLNLARKKAEREALGFMTQFIQGLMDDGSPENVRKAAALRKSIFDDMLRNGLDIKMTKFLEANERLAAQPGQSGAKTQQELSESLYEMVGNYITASGAKERELWGAVPNIEIISPMSPDTDFANLPAFMRVFEEQGFLNPSVQKQFEKSIPVLFDFIDDARRDLGLTPLPKLSDAEIASAEKYKSSFDNAVAKLAGFDAENEIVTIMETANALPLGEQATFLRRTEQDIRQNLKNLAEPEDQKRLAVALDQAANYAGVQATNENRAVQRAGEASQDVSGITADQLAEIRSKLLRQARALAADPATSDEARRVGAVAEAMSDDMDIEGFGEAYDVARAYTRAKHDFFTRTVVGDVGASKRSGAPKLPPELTFEMFIKSNPSITLSRTRQLQGMAEFADQQGLPNFLPEEVAATSEPVFTTTTNLIDSYLRGLKQVASKEVFDPKTQKTVTVINAQGLDQWKKDNANVLEVFPQLKEDLVDAASAQRAVEVMQQNLKKGRAIARNQTDLAKLIGGMSPTAAVANAFNSDTAVKSFRNLFALRRMGADNVRSRQAARTGQLRALKNARSAEIQEAGLDTTEVNAAMGRAVLEHAYLAAGGEGAFNPQVFYQTLFGKMPKADQSLMDVADQFNIFPEKVKTRLKFMTQQMMKVQAADAAGRLADPDFVTSAGPIIDFYVGVLGSAAGSAAFKQVGGSGPGVISASSTGTREVRKFVLELPQTAKLRAIDMMFTDPVLIASLMQKPGTESGQQKLSARIVSYLNDKLFNTATSMSPFIVREGFEEEDRGLDSPLAEDPNVEIPALQERMRNQQQQPPVLPPSNQQGALNPPVQIPTPNSGPAPSPVQQQPAAVQSASQGSGPVDRARFAALFPEDRELLGIGSLMGQA